MRAELKLQVRDPGSLIPINYQYELSSWIYRVISRSDGPFGRWLHDQGYQHEGKLYKLFNFSSLRVPRRAIEGDRLRLLSPEAYLTVSFCAGPQADHFIGGLFREQRLELGDTVSRARLAVDAIQGVPPPGAVTALRLRTLSPVCLSVQELRNGRMTPTYLAPDAADYGTRLLDNLIRKYLSLPDLPLLDPAAGPDWSFQLLSEPRSRLITLAAHTERETRVRGYEFSCEISGPAVLLNFLMDAGLGEKNSMGFGCMGILT